MKTDGSIVGDICPPRISIVGSAHFKGGIEIDSTKSPATADVGKRLYAQGRPGRPKNMCHPRLVIDGSSLARLN